MPLRAGLMIAMALMVAHARADGPYPPVRTVLRQAFATFGAVERAALSGDGRFVAFVSTKPLVPADRNSFRDVYVFDRERALLSLESITRDGESGNSGSGSPSLSADGRYLAFDSDASNLLARADRQVHSNVFVRDRTTGMIRLLSIAPDRGPSNGSSDRPVISADGNIVAFTTAATNLMSSSDGNGGERDVYRYRIDTSEVSRVSAADAAQDHTTMTFGPALSHDGHVMAFVTTAGAGVPDPFRLDVVVRDFTSSTVTCISCSEGARTTRRRAHSPSVSGDGRFVAFVLMTVNGQLSRTDIVLHDRRTSTSVVVTRDANGNSARPQMTADGRLVVFDSTASNLPCGPCTQRVADDNLVTDIYAFDRTTGTFMRQSGAHARWWTPSVSPVADALGTTIVFSSRQPFGDGDPTADFDLFVCTPACP